jgi:Putative transposase/Transposase zinc-binding domain
MTTLAEIVRRYGPVYRARYGEQLLPSQQAALTAIEACRTAVLGGQVFGCPDCGTMRYSYHSCRNRHCPTCQHDAAQSWLEQQHDLLLPVPYFLVTFTLPSELRDVAYRHQRTLYTLLFRASAAALMELASDPRFLGAQIGLLGVLQTWTRDLRYHPHIHYLAPGGGLASDGRSWVTAKANFLLHVKPLAALFRAKLRAALRQTALWAEIPAAAWQQPWVVDCRPVGTARAALKYLAPYIFRVALSNNRIVQLVDDQVTFRYTIGATGQTAYRTLPVQEFLRRFLQHILPKGFVKVRYYGLFRVGMRRSLARLRSQLQLLQHIADQVTPAPAGSDGSPRVVICPSCGQPMRLERVVLSHNRGPPGWVNQQQWQKLGMCRCRVAWLAMCMPASACPGAVLTTTRTCNSGRAQRSPALLRALHHAVSIHELRVYGPERRHTTADQRLSGHVPTPTPR